MGDKASDRQREAFAYLIDEEVNYTIIEGMLTFSDKDTEARNKLIEEHISKPLACIRDAVHEAKQLGFSVGVSIEDLSPDSEAGAAWAEQRKELPCKLEALWTLRVDLLAKVWMAETVDELRGILSDARKQLRVALD